MNYVTVGDASKPALLLIPGQTESWWGYEKALGLLGEHFEAFAVDLRGQGRSSRTPGRYTLDNIGNDLVRFIDLVIGAPDVRQQAAPRAACCRRGSRLCEARPGPRRGLQRTRRCSPFPVAPATGPGIRQAIGAMFGLWSTYLGDQWSIGDWDGVAVAAPDVLPTWMQAGFKPPAEPPQTLKEYDPG